MRYFLASAFSAVLAASASGAPAPPPPPRFGAKPLGVLLLTSVGGPGWDKTVAEIQKGLGRDMPLETVVGTPSPPDLRHALERLKAARAEKIVVVPVYLHSDDDDLDQIHYILGMKKYPSAGFMKAGHAHMSQIVIKRAVFNFKKPPIVLTQALDADPALPDALLERAKKLGHDPALEAVVLVGGGSGDMARDQAYRTILERHAKALRRNGRYRAVRAVLVASDAPPLRDQTPDLSKSRGSRLPSSADSGRELREAVQALSNKGHVIVLPYLLTPDGSERAYRKTLENAFILWDGKGMLPHERIASWIKARIVEGSGLPDMVKFRDEGLALPPPERKKVVR
jgi:sirohydrochlorin ferrochelatase